MGTKTGSYSFVVRDRFNELKANAAKALVTKVPQKENEGTITEQAERVDCNPKTILVALNACRLKCRVFESGKDRETLLSNLEVDEWFESDLFAADDAGATDFDAFSQELSDALVKGESEYPEDLESIGTFLEVLELAPSTEALVLTAIEEGTLVTYFPNGENCPEGAQVSETDLAAFFETLEGAPEVADVDPDDLVAVPFYLPQEVAGLIDGMDAARRQMVTDMISSIVKFGG